MADAGTGTRRGLLEQLGGTEWVEAGCLKVERAEPRMVMLELPDTVRRVKKRKPPNRVTVVRTDEDVYVVGWWAWESKAVADMLGEDECATLAQVRALIKERTGCPAPEHEPLAWEVPFGRGFPLHTLADEVAY